MTLNYVDRMKSNIQENFDLYILGRNDVHVKLVMK